MKVTDVMTKIIIGVKCVNLIHFKTLRATHDSYLSPLRNKLNYLFVRPKIVYHLVLMYRSHFTDCILNV